MVTKVPLSISVGHGLAGREQTFSPNSVHGPNEDIGSYEVILDVKVFDTYVIQELIAVFSDNRYSRLSRGGTWTSWQRTDIDSIELNPLTSVDNPSSFDFDSNLQSFTCRWCRRSVTNKRFS